MKNYAYFTGCAALRERLGEVWDGALECRETPEGGFSGCRLAVWDMTPERPYTRAETARALSAMAGGVPFLLLPTRPVLPAPDEFSEAAAAAACAVLPRSYLRLLPQEGPVARDLPAFEIQAAPVLFRNSTFVSRRRDFLAMEYDRVRENALWAVSYGDGEAISAAWVMTPALLSGPLETVFYRLALRARNRL